MTFSPDIESDCLLVDGIETVTLHAASSITVDGAKRGAWALDELEFRQVGLESRDLVWILPDVCLAGVVPQQGNVIEDSTGAMWTILSARKSLLSGTWRAATRRQV